MWRQVFIDEFIVNIHFIAQFSQREMWYIYGWNIYNMFSTFYFISRLNYSIITNVFCWRSASWYLILIHRILLLSVNNFSSVMFLRVINSICKRAFECLHAIRLFVSKLRSFAVRKFPFAFSLTTSESHQRNH